MRAATTSGMGRGGFARQGLAPESGRGHRAGSLEVGLPPPWGGGQGVARVLLEGSLVWSWYLSAPLTPATQGARPPAL